MLELQELTADFIKREGPESRCVGFVFTREDLPDTMQHLSAEDLDDLFDYLNYEDELYELLYQAVQRYVANNT